MINWETVDCVSIDLQPDEFVVPKRWEFSVTIPFEEIDPEIIRILLGYSDELNYLWEPRD